MRAIARKLSKVTQHSFAGDQAQSATQREFRLSRSPSVACGSRSQRPESIRLATHPALHDYAQDRLSGLIAPHGGIAFNGPVAVWKGRRAVHRQSRRWSRAWSPEQIAQRLKRDFPKDSTKRTG